MKIMQELISYGLRQVIGDIADKAVEAVLRRFTDESQELPKAIAAANDRTWRALAVALAGDGFWDKLKRNILNDATERAVREQLDPFCACAIEFESLPVDFRKACLQELNRLRKSGALKTSHLPANELKVLITAWNRYGDPQGVLDGAWKAVAGVATALKQDNPKLSHLLRQRMGKGPPLLAALFSFFLRQEITKNKDLADRLTFDLLRNLFKDQEAAFEDMTKALDAIGDKLDVILGELGEIKQIVEKNQAILLDLQEEMRHGVGEMQRIHAEAIALLGKQGMQVGVLSARHSLSIHNDDERIAVDGLLQELRQLPAEQQRQVPALLNGLGKLLVGAGKFAEARRIFAEAALVAPDDTARAEIQYNAYRAAVEQGNWDGALAAIQAAATLDPVRFTFFPAHRYKLKRILGAGGFGTAFLCQDEILDQLRVIKTLHEDVMERSLKDVFKEARVLRDLSDPAIIGGCDGEFADTVGKKRPYIVMDYFPGMTLRAYVEQHGELKPEEYLDVARQLVSGMLAAHRQGIWHRDLKPDNILVQREGERFSVKIIDFGLALRRQVVETSVARAGTEPTVLGNSAAGTLAYSAPEQMGRIAGVKTGAYSDVFAFGKTSWFALFKTTEPKSRHLKMIPKELTELLEKCTEEHPNDRFPSFEGVAAQLDSSEDHRKKRLAKGEKKPRKTPNSDRELILLLPPNTLNAENLLEYAKSLEGKQLVTLAQEKPFKLQIVQEGIRFVPESRKSRLVSRQRVQRVCDKYVESRSMKKSDYKDITFDASYLLAIVDRFLRDRMKRTEESDQNAVEATPLPKAEPPTTFTNSLFMEFILAPGATFWMGERGKQQVFAIPHLFYIGIYPVTQSQWQAVMGNNPSWFSRGGHGADTVCDISDADLRGFPVEQVSWKDVDEFIEKLNALEENRVWVYRLPTEAEWEYVCRGGATTKPECAFDFYFDEPTNDASSWQANIKRHSSVGEVASKTALERPSKVGSYQANRLGLYDMHGNVWEWCLDVIDGGRSDHVVCGGSWNETVEDCRATARSRLAPSYRDSTVGFRLVRVPS